MGLVAYDSDSSSNVDDHEGSKPASTSTAQRNGASQDAPSLSKSQKRKALPSLPEVYTSKDIRDDPALHQGRKRTRPFVDGDYDTHVYISLSVSKRVHRALDRIIERARELCLDHNLVSLLDIAKSNAQDPQMTTSTGPRDLHVSLTHPFPLRRSQIESFAADLTQRLLSSSSRISNGPFQLSFAGGLKMYYNGVKTGGQGTGGRAFLAFQVGAGHPEIDAIVESAIHPLLHKLHLPLYHSNPEYHASFAWCLIDPRGDTEASTLEDVADLENGYEDAPALVPIPGSVVRQLDEELRDAFLKSQPYGGWRVIDLKLKIGREVRSIKL